MRGYSVSRRIHGAFAVSCNDRLKISSPASCTVCYDRAGIRYSTNESSGVDQDSCWRFGHGSTRKAQIGNIRETPPKICSLSTTVMLSTLSSSLYEKSL